MKIEWNKVTRFSATMALILFLALPFYGFWLGSVYGGTKQYDRDVRADAAQVFAAPVQTATKIIDYVPPAPLEGATVVAGSCWTNSIAAPYRDDAWRCTVGNAIHDPCFQIPGSANLLCDPTPGTTQDASIVLSLIKPLPKPEGHLSPATAYDGAWLIELKGGIVCSPFTGTLPFSDKGDVASYGCSDKRLIFGVNADKKVWTATVGSLGTPTADSPPPLVNRTTLPIIAAWK
jgi:hypothetical protein